TMRIVGAAEVAESPALQESTLACFEQFEQNNSPAHIIFPRLLTPGYLRRLIAATRLYITFSGLAATRRKTGCRRDDALQFLMDLGTSMTRIVSVSRGLDP